MLSSSQLQHYLKCIKVSESKLQPSFNTLSAIQDQHTKCLPFANITTSRAPKQFTEIGFPNVIPDLTSDGLTEKLLMRRWGGYCFEQNNLMAKVLSALGFDLYATAARVVESISEQQGVHVHGFDHQCILARVPECPVWHLVDVGFGANCPVQPLALEAPDTDAFTGVTHRVRRGFLGKTGVPSEEDLARRPHSCGWYLQKHSNTNKRWEDLYFFQETEALQRDFGVMNYWIATNEQSKFVRSFVASLRNDEGGRTTLSDTKLKIFNAEGIVSETELETAQEFRAALETCFGIVL